MAEDYSPSRFDVILKDKNSIRINTLALGYHPSPLQGSHFVAFNR